MVIIPEASFGDETVAPSGTNIEKSFDSFSRIGFVAGEGNFLLESVPSKDKKPFYSFGL